MYEKHQQISLDLRTFPRIEVLTSLLPAEVILQLTLYFLYRIA